MKPKVSYAFKNEDGDILLKLSVDWYVLSKDAQEAYLIKSGSYSSSKDGLEVSFGNELERGAIVNVKYDAVKNEVGVKASFGKKAGFDIDEFQELEVLTEAEREELLNAILNNEISFVGIPESRDVEQALQLPNGDYLVVSCSKSNYAYETLRMFTGSSVDDLREIKINNVERYRDGGTTFYYTDEGILFSPSGFKGGISTKWSPNDVENNNCNPKDWEDENHPAQKLEKLDVQEFASTIGLSDMRIRGIQTWDEHAKLNGPI